MATRSIDVKIDERVVVFERMLRRQLAAVVDEVGLV
jgi:hypothetical protein